MSAATMTSGTPAAQATGEEKDAVENEAQGHPGRAQAFRRLADELAEALTDMDEFRAAIRRTRPQYAHTLDWDEHPERLER